jgi:hypothetical protein
VGAATPAGLGWRPWAVGLDRDLASKHYRRLGGPPLVPPGLAAS